MEQPRFADRQAVKPARRPRAVGSRGALSGSRPPCQRRSSDMCRDIRQLVEKAGERGDEFLVYLLSLALAHATERAAMEAYMGGVSPEPER